jgi:hypothetical protein
MIYYCIAIFTEKRYSREKGKIYLGTLSPGLDPNTSDCSSLALSFFKLVRKNKEAKV